jgi:hypothetical protein
MLTEKLRHEGGYGAKCMMSILPHGVGCGVEWMWGELVMGRNRFTPILGVSRPTGVNLNIPLVFS